MKRLLTYLFIVFGLGLTFSNNAKADIVEACIFEKDYSTTDNPDVRILYSFNLFKKPKINNDSVYCEYFTEKKKEDKKIVEILGKNIQTKTGSTRYWKSASDGERSRGWNYVGTLSAWNYNEILKNNGSISKIYKPIKKTQIQKVAKKIDFENTLVTKKGKNEKILNLRLCKKNNSYVILKDTLFCYQKSGYEYTSKEDKLNFLSKNIICFEKSVNRVFIKKQQCSSGEFQVFYHKYSFYWFYEDKNIKVAGTKPKKKSEETINDQAKLEEEKRKIAEEKKKIEEEKKRIADAKKKQEEEERKKKEEKDKLYIIGSGTGFFVSAQGHIVSNDHVVGICRKVVSKIEGELKYFNVLKTDKVNDLGLIKGDYKSPSYLSIKSDGAEFGEDIIAFGYPLEDELSTSVKLTRGIVSSLSGPGNNYSEIQIDAAIQPGNSGGPVMNMDGQVVGVASSGLNKLYMLEKSEYIPENVNFAVASSTLSNFLKANGVSITNQKFNIKNTKELAKIGRPATLQLFCMNTKAVFEELKKKKKHSDVLFEKVMDIK